MGQKESKLARNRLDNLAPNNSDKATRDGERDESRQKLKPIVKGKVIRKKKGAFDKFKEAFLGESENLGDYILYDVLVPAFRDTISDMGFGVIEKLFGNGRSRYGGYYNNHIVRDRGRSYVSYNSVSSSNRRNGRDERREVDRGSRARHEFDRIIFTNKGEAEDVLAHLVDMTIEYGEATVRSFYELSNIESDYTDDNYGWINLRDAYVDRTRDGYIIVFPPTRPL
jgi:hypothetical protein